MRIPASTGLIAVRNLAITNGVGESPSGEFLRGNIASNTLLTSEGRTPFGEVASSKITVASAARFAGMEGETPLARAVRDMAHG
jgi:hypothetical protein